MTKRANDDMKVIAIGCGLIVATVLFACFCVGLCVRVFWWATGI